MAITVNIYYKGTGSSAKQFANEMTESGTVDAIRNEAGNLRYEYFSPLEDEETVLLIDSWENQEAIDVHHASPMMKTIMELREKYHLHMRVERYVSDDGIPDTDKKYIKEQELSEMKKLWAVVLCLVLLFSIAACGSSSGSDQTEGEENKSTEADFEAETDTAEAMTETTKSKIAVVCFSGTGNTMAVAETIAEVTDGDLYEIIPAEKYTEEDLNYTDDNCRANKEQNDPDVRPAIKNDLSAVEEYDIIYLGHPIWWGTNPRIIQTFLDTNDLTDTIIYTFCTSGGSGIEKSISDLRTLYPDLHIVTGKRLNNASEEDVIEWIGSLAV